ncbi:MAG: glycosyltransferase family 4 protein [Clostridia bacterium]|nr:glycosyltransferase family 4 protein [Clostridia bacterium]
MLILSNSLTQVDDEGGLKLATSIVKRIKQKDGNTYVATFEREFAQSDVHLTLNKFHVSRQLISLIRKQAQPVLYIPFPAPTTSMAIRIRLLSLVTKKGLKVMLVRQYPMSKFAQRLLKGSKAEVVVFSKKAQEFYSEIVGDRTLYLKTGIDTEKFVPVSSEKSKELKVKYGFSPDKPVVLHVGHMKEGRNVRELMKISDKYQVVLVVSTLSKERQNEQLRQELTSCPNIRILDGYLPDIEEIYQLSDVYFFPVKQVGHCIDVPLSCLEAAACNKPVITTDYGEMREFVGKDGFNFIDEIESETLNESIETALNSVGYDTRSAVLEYDWSKAVEALTTL